MEEHGDRLALDRKLPGQVRQLYLEGTCGTSFTCGVTQIYTRGELEGAKYAWSGKYTANGNVNTFTGTWFAHRPNKNRGNWSATAVCKKT